MKIVIFSLMAFLGLNISAYAAEKVTLETLMTCKELDGDKWLEVGIIKGEENFYDAILVGHNSDGSLKRVGKHGQLVGKKSDETMVYYNGVTFKLAVTMKESGLSGDLFMWTNYSLKNLNCNENSTISYDKERYN